MFVHQKAELEGGSKATLARLEPDSNEIMEAPGRVEELESKSNERHELEGTWDGHELRSVHLLL
jgi:hypothetical protein